MTRERGDVTDRAYFDFLRRIVTAGRRRITASADLEGLAELGELAAILNDEIAAAVTALRGDLHHPASWAEIGDALGITRQAAQQRFRKAGGLRRPGGQPAQLR